MISLVKKIGQDFHHGADTNKDTRHFYEETEIHFLLMHFKDHPSKQGRKLKTKEWKDLTAVLNS
jgi:hypothetical protein